MVPITARTRLTTTALCNRQGGREAPISYGVFMAINLKDTIQIIRGKKADIAARIGTNGELNWAEDTYELYIHDGKTRGGHIIGKSSGTVGVVGGAGIAVSTSDGISTVSVKRDPSNVLYATTDGAGVRIGTSGALQITAQNALDLRVAEGGGIIVDSNGVKIDSAVLSSVFRYAGQVNSVDDLPSDAQPGDVYDVKDSGVNYVWSGSSWDNLGGIMSVDTAPTQGSTNPVASGGVYDAIQDAKLSGDGTTVTVANNTITAKDIAIKGNENDLASESGLLGTLKYIPASNSTFNVDTDIFDEVLFYNSNNSRGTLPLIGWWIVKQFNYHRDASSRLQIGYRVFDNDYGRIFIRFYHDTDAEDPHWSEWVEVPTLESFDTNTLSVNDSGKLVVSDVAIDGDVSDLASERGQIGDNLYKSAVDFNSYTKSGVYALKDIDAAENRPPYGTNGFLVVYASNPGHARQVFYRIGNPGISDYVVATRIYATATSTWSEWYLFITGKNIGDGLTMNGAKLSVPEYEGATASTTATSGLVPPAAAGDQDKYLGGDGEWHEVAVPSLNGELAARHEGVTENGAGNYANYMLVVPDAVSLADNMKLDDSGATSNLNDVLAIGYNALGTALRTPSKRCSDNIAIGSETMSQGAGVGPHNIAIGLWALRDLEGTKLQDANNGGFDADRNIAIGSLAFTHMTKGRCNVGLGRDVGQTVTTGNYNTFIGYAAAAGSAPVGLDGTIALQNELTGNYNTVVGSNSAKSLNGVSKNNAVFGGYAAQHVKNVDLLTVVGGNAAESLDYYKSKNNKKLFYPDETVSYTQSGTELTVMYKTDGMASSGYIRLVFKSGDISQAVASDQQTLDYIVNASGYPVVSSPAMYDGATGQVQVVLVEMDEVMEDTATYATIVGGKAAQHAKSVRNSTIVGNSALEGVAKDYDGTSSAEFSEIIGALTARHGIVTCSLVAGYHAGGGGHVNATTISDSACLGCDTAYYATKVNRSVLLGRDAGRYSTQFETSVIIGWTAHNSSGDVTRSVIIGANSGPKNISGGASSSDVFVGASAGNGVGKGNSENCTAIGTGAMSAFTSFDSEANKIQNSIALGAWSKVTGSNQCQLGTSGVTTYAYGSVQDRSDERDKTDIRDTVLGLDFITALRPVDFRWDYRDDYVEVQDTGEVDAEGAPLPLKVLRYEKDGSRKRKRFHHGLIAQEVKSVMDDLGVDFGGYQDHKINGGADVLTIGYAEYRNLLKNRHNS